MRNLIAFVIRYHFFLLFLLLEAFAFVLIANSTYYQQASILNTSNLITGKVYGAFDNVTDYLSLRQTNYILSEENARLRKATSLSFLKADTNSFFVNDTINKLRYTYIAAKVINNSVNKRNNYIMLNKGRKQGIQKDMAVITSNGIVGTVVSVSDNFSWVMSVLNKRTKISGRIKKNNQMGTIIWEGKDFSVGTLSDIPAHVKIAKGDTIVTSGFSYIFPAGIFVGTIKDFRVEQGDHFYVIPFIFGVDFNSLDYVYVVKDLSKKEVMNLENTVKDE
ncbi:MAG TPA: rod shape-determining protein MreC [Bacteroidales bacterium]|jgi:rod shape-determining protein MreC